MRWTVVIPTKALPAAKSRLLPASADAAAHRRLVEAIRADTIGAAADAESVARILLVLDRGPAPAEPLAIVQTRAGLDGALLDAAEFAASRWPADGVAALVGDLPALRASELTAALAAVSGAGFVADADGTGTTLLAAPAGHVLEPRFGAGSAARHAERAALLPAGAGLRHDVDTPEDLRAAIELGVGPATAALVAPTGVDVRSPCVGRI